LLTTRQDTPTPKSKSLVSSSVSQDLEEFSLKGDISLKGNFQSFNGSQDNNYTSPDMPDEKGKGTEDG
jgi:hypothetical protein